LESSKSLTPFANPPFTSEKKKSGIMASKNRMDLHECTNPVATNQRRLKMRTTPFKLMVPLLIAVLVAFSGGIALAEKPIVIGCPLSTAFLYGWDAERGVTLAIEEINAQGGVNVGGKKRPLKIEVIDTRDLGTGRAGQ
jgi:ABC-type branched-subunit amino acid transport system substrate-binding protein